MGGPSDRSEKQGQEDLLDTRAVFTDHQGRATAGLPNAHSADVDLRKKPVSAGALVKLLGSGLQGKPAC
jgi:hypothetical protein